VKKGTKEGTKEGTHPRLTFERAQRESSFRLALEGKATSKRTITVGAAAAAAAANYYNAASRRDLFARTIHGQPNKAASVSRRTQINSQRRRPVPATLASIHCQLEELATIKATNHDEQRGQQIGKKKVCRLANRTSDSHSKLDQLRLLAPDVNYHGHLHRHEQRFLIPTSSGKKAPVQFNPGIHGLVWCTENVQVHIQVICQEHH
jgi:hypothetical protein